MSWVWLVLSIGFEVGATLCLRASDGLRRRAWLLPVATGYACAFTFLALSLAAGMPVGVAYGVWTAIGVVLIAVLAWRIWDEPVTRRMLLGMGLIVLGVFLVEIG